MATSNEPWGNWPIVRPVGVWRPRIIAAIYALALLPLTVLPRHSGNVFSRYMTIEAIVERGELAIERSPLLARSGSPDVVKFGTHFYSDKPPVLSAIASPIYALLNVLGVRFSGPGYQFAVSNLAITWGVVGLASAWTLVSIRRLLQVVPIPPWAADLLTLAFGFGSQLLTYAVTFNNHSVGAALITAAFALTVLEPPGRARHRARFLAGFCAALAATIDLPAGGLFLAGLFVIQAIRTRSVPWAYLLGSVGPLLFHGWLQSLVTGTPLPAEMYPEAFHYPGSYWLTPEGTWRERGPRFLSALDLVVGPQGWLTVTPALIFGLVGLGMSTARRADPLRPSSWLVGISALILILYYTWGVRRLDFAGSSFGTRHLLPITPVCYVFGVVALGRLRGWWPVVLFLPLLGIGFVYSIAGMSDPWTRIERREKAEPMLHAVQRLVPFRPPWTPR
ncbi:hypothetical protein P12x_003123 [Tundrisphaera lichenicola]|uniref:hypothetical protein n=1 Tax=Tundrisphaera lichenicola TaxID=2029860 RepID=UPI003EB7053C